MKKALSLIVVTQAFLLLSGGSTPKNLYKELSKLDLDWENVTVALVDERYVSTDHKHSNEKMIKDSLNFLWKTFQVSSQTPSLLSMK